jgi:hypothetical protein
MSQGLKPVWLGLPDARAEALAYLRDKSDDLRDKSDDLRDKSDDNGQG